jgi:hypothetical protein
MKSKQGDGTLHRGPGPGPWKDTKNPTDGMQWMPTLLLGMTRAGPGIVAMQMNSRPTKCNAVIAPGITTLLDDMRTTDVAYFPIATGLIKNSLWVWLSSLNYSYRPHEDEATCCAWH